MWMKWCWLGLLLCTLSGCGNVNTTIASPSVYWEHGLWATLGFVAVCGLIFFALTGLAMSFDPSEHDSAIVSIATVFLVTAGLLLQTMPHVSHGIRFLPTLPWQQDGAATVVSWAVWLCIGVAFFCVNSEAKGAWRVAAGALVLALTLNALLSFEAGDTAKADWIELKQQRTEMLKTLLYDREQLISRIRNLGFTSKRDLIGDDTGRTLIEELAQLSRQIVGVEHEVADIDSALERTQSVQRRADRHDRLNCLPTPPQEEIEKLSEKEHEARDRSPDHEVRLDRLLDEVFSQGSK